MIFTKTPIDNNALAKIKVQPPANHAGQFWRPIEHHKLNLMLTKWLYRKGWLIGDPIIHLSNNQLDMVAAWPLEVKGGTYSVGILNSNSQLYSLRMYAGICGTVMTEIDLGRHTQHKLEDRIRQGIDKLEERLPEFRIRQAELIAKPIDRYSLLMIMDEAEAQKLITGSRSKRTKDLFPKGDENAWALYDCFLQVIQINQPLDQMRQAYSFYKILLGSTNG